MFVDHMKQTILFYEIQTTLNYILNVITEWDWRSSEILLCSIKTADQISGREMFSEPLTPHCHASF